MDDHYLALVYLRPIVDYVRDHGRPVESVLAAIGVEERDFEDPFRLVRDEVIDRAFEAARRLVDDPNLALHAASYMKLGQVGIVGHLMMSCGTIADLFRLAARFARLIGSGAVPVYTYHEHGVEIVTRIERQTPYPVDAIEFGLGSAAVLAKQLTGTEFLPAAVHLPFPDHPRFDEHRAIFQCPFHFDAGEIRISVPNAVASTRLFGGDRSLHRLLGDEAQARLAALLARRDPGTQWIDELRRTLADRIALGVPAIDSVAIELGMTARTLQRRLRSEGTSYSALVDGIRRDAAESLVADSSITLGEIALRLGFAEQSGLNHAFRRWFGRSPGAVRTCR